MPTPLRQSLASAIWTVRAVGDLSLVPAHIRGRSIPATVPGCIHTDLMDAGLIPDPAIGDSEEHVQWVSHADWRYECTFEADPCAFDHHEIDLIFDCLDTIATIELNGDKIGESASEFLPHRFSILGLLKPGPNHLAVTFKSPLRHIREEAARLGPRPVNGDWAPFVFIRKCASNFRWDWGPAVATCGISASVRLHAWSIVRVSQVTLAAPEVQRFQGQSNRGDRSIQADVKLQWSRRGAEGRTIKIGHALGEIGRGTVPPKDVLKVVDGQSSIWLGGALPQDPLWWPSGHGPQTRYGYTIAILVDGLFQEWRSCHLGFAVSALHTDAQDFAININGRRIFCRGVNWIPESLWPRDRTPERIRARLQALRDANINTIRVWGGGQYEPDGFYDLCNELGIMVWQDFMFSCGMYPEEEPLRSQIETEARHHVSRLSRHPSVVLWCGGNECVWGYENWGWKKGLKKPDGTESTWGRGYYEELLPRIVAELDPSRQYWPNSPWTPAENGEKRGWLSRFMGEKPAGPNDAASGDRHTWDVWGDGYRTITPRFCSEFGQQSPSNWATLAEAGLIDPHQSPTRSDEPPSAASALEPRGSESLVPAALIRRQRGPGGIEGSGITPMQRWYDQPMSAWFRPPRTFQEWHYLAQLLQARSLSIGIEWLRVNQPTCSGALIWQANDAWPGFSWSIIDSAGRKKLAWYAVKRSFSPRLLSIHPIDGRPVLFAVNDADGLWTIRGTAQRRNIDGHQCASKPIEMTILPHSAARVADLQSLLGAPSDPTRELLRVSTDDSSLEHFYVPDKDAALPEPRFELSVESNNDQTIVRIAAISLLRDACVIADRLDPAAESDSQLVTLLPGESHDFKVRGLINSDAAAIRNAVWMSRSDRR